MHNSLACAATLAIALAIHAPGADAVTAITDWESGFMTFYGARPATSQLPISCDSRSAMQLVSSSYLTAIISSRNPDLVACGPVRVHSEVAQETLLTSLLHSVRRRSARRCVARAHACNPCVVTALRPLAPTC